MEIVKTALTVYAWMVVGLLLFFLWRIAAFYERASGKHVGSRFLGLPGVLLAAGVAWYGVRNVDFVGQPVGDLLLFAGGSLLFLFSTRLVRLMTGDR
ncbi:MAG: hypothetical protein PVH41_09385 [Anaerolineae bacterium]